MAGRGLEAFFKGLLAPHPENFLTLTSVPSRVEVIKVRTMIVNFWI
jgi:hypothetical protein